MLKGRTLYPKQQVRRTHVHAQHHTTSTIDGLPDRILLVSPLLRHTEFKPLLH